MMVVATAGTTDTGSIDPLAECADVADRHDLWFHVDAAYGGFFALTDRGRSLLAGIERADSITIDAHKSLLVPYGVGGLLVADGRALVEAHEGRGAYMQDVVDDPRVPDYFALGAELSRPYRGLDIWLPLHIHGVDAFRAELDRMLDLARRAAARLRGVPGIELAVQPTLSIVGFRCSTGNADTAEVLARLNHSGEVHVSSTTVDDRLTLRLAFLNHRTSIAIADRAVEIVAEAVAELRQGGASNPVAA
jgi:aromatic-L-amino-acid decarboxylase